MIQYSWQKAWITVGTALHVATCSLGRNEDFCSLIHVENDKLTQNKLIAIQVKPINNAYRFMFKGTFITLWMMLIGYSYIHKAFAITIFQREILQQQAAKKIGFLVISVYSPKVILFSFTHLTTVHASSKAAGNLCSGARRYSTFNTMHSAFLQIV